VPPPNAATAAAAAAAALLPAAADARVANVRFCLCRRRLAAEFCHFIVVLPFWGEKMKKWGVAKPQRLVIQKHCDH